MRITIVQGAFFPVPPIMGGAVEKVWFALGQEFARRGHTVVHLSRRHPALPKEEMLQGVRHVRVGGFNAPHSLVWLKLLDLAYTLRVWAALPPADILVTNTFWLPLLARGRGRGQLYVHVARYPKGQMSWYAHAARLQTVSRPIAEAILQQAPATAAKVRVVPYPLGAECFAPADTVANRLAGSGLLYVGRVHPEKGMDVLLSAFRTLAQSSHGAGGLTVVGPWQKELGGGGTAYYERLRQQAQSQAEKVRWIGPVFEPARLAAYYDQAALFVYPSLAEKGETFGLAPLEAMARGCPPLVSNLACFQDFIRPEETGFVFDHRRPDADRVLGDKIQSLLAAPERLRETGRRAFAKAQEYALPLVATRYLEDFAALLDVQN